MKKFSALLVLLTISLCAAQPLTITFKNLKGTECSAASGCHETGFSAGLTFSVVFKDGVEIGLESNGECLTKVFGDVNFVTYLGFSEFEGIKIASMLVIDYKNNRVTYVQSRSCPDVPLLHKAILTVSGKYK